MEKRSFELKRLLIIGNGFDLDLNLKTQYKDFLGSDKYFPKEEGSSLIKYIKQQYSIQKWIDLEIELKKFCDICLSRDERELLNNPEKLSGYLKEKRIDLQLHKEFHFFDPKKEKTGYDALCNGLLSYMKNLNYNNINDSSTAAELLRTLINDEPLNILSFNYTSLDAILKKIDVNVNVEYKAYYIHGTAYGDNIILGIEDNVDIHHEKNFMIKSFSPHYRSNNIPNLLANTRDVIFFGHSLGESDYHYFQDFFSQCCISNDERRKISIFTRDDQSRMDILTQLRVMNNKKTSSFFASNDFNIYCTNEERDNRRIRLFLKELDAEIEKENARMNAIMNARKENLGIY